MLTLYIYLFFFRDPGESHAQAGLEELGKAEPSLTNIEVDNLLKEVGIIGQEDDPNKRRFASSFPPGTDNTPKKLPLPDETGTIQEVSPLEPLPFFGVEPGVGEGTLPDSDPGDEPTSGDGSNSNGASLPPNVEPVDGSGAVRTHFYNMPVTGDKVLFVLDASSGGSERKGDEVLGLERELQRVVDSLSKEIEFNIWVFRGGKMAWCYDKFLPATSGNKAYSMIWINSYLELDADQFNEENKPDGYPGMYTSHSGLGWASPLFLAVENRPTSIFFVTSGWKTEQRVLAPIPTNVDWSPQKEASWQAAVSETKAWIQSENEERATQGLPPRPIFNMKQLVSRRYPDIAIPPATPVISEDKIYQELKARIEGAGDLGQCPIHVVIQHGDSPQGIQAMNKFKSLLSPYKGGVYLIK